MLIELSLKNLLLKNSKRWEEFWQGQTKPLHRDDSPDLYARHAAELRVLFSSLEPERVLEIGCGNGAFYKRLGFDDTVYKGVDFSISMLEEFRKKHCSVNLECCSAEAYCDGETYDLVFANGVAQCLDYKMLYDFFLNARKMLHKDSMFVCSTVPWNVHRLRYFLGKVEKESNEGLKAYIKEVFYRSFGKWYSFAEFEDIALGCGMSVRFYGSVEYVYRFHAVLRPVYGLRISSQYINKHKLIKAQDLLEQGSIKHAEKIIKNTLKANSKNQTAKLLLGQIYLKKGIQQKAISFLEEAWKTSKDPDVSLLIAKEYLKNGENEKSIEVIKKQQEAEPSFRADLHSLLEIAYRNINRDYKNSEIFRLLLEEYTKRTRNFFDKQCNIHLPCLIICSSFQCHISLFLLSLKQLGITGYVLFVKESEKSKYHNIPAITFPKTITPSTAKDKKLQKIRWKTLIILTNQSPLETYKPIIDFCSLLEPETIINVKWNGKIEVLS